MFSKCSNILEETKKIITVQGHYVYRNNEDPQYELINKIDENDEMYGFYIYLTEEYVGDEESA